MSGLVSGLVPASLAALAAAVSASAGTTVGGPILANTTWTLASSPYEVTTSVLIGGGATLTIEPGVVVRISDGLGIQVGSPEGFGPGTLVARGTAGQPIRFTSNATPGTQAAGDWTHIFFTDFAVDAVYSGDQYQSGSVLQHVIVEYAGGGSNTTGSVTVQSSSPFIDNVEVRQSARSGLRMDGSTAPAFRITNSEFWACSNTGQQGGGVYIANGSGHLISNNDFHDNVNNSAGGGLYIQNASNVTVAGNQFTGNQASNGGGFYGTNLANLVFQGNTVTGNSSSNYGGAYLDGSSIDVLSNTFAGNSATNWAGFYASGANAVITGNTSSGNTASNTGGGGHVDGTGAVIGGNEWSGNSGSSIGGVDVSGANVTFSGNTIINNQATNNNGDIGGLSVQSAGGMYSGNVITGNSAGRNGGGVLVSGSGHDFVGNTISGNMAGDLGGGVYINAQNTDWDDNEITGNSAGVQGGGVYNNQPGTSFEGDQVANVFNTIAGNSAPTAPAVFHNVANGPNGNLAAQYVCWGTNDLNEVQAMVWDFFDSASLGIVFTFPLVEDCVGGGCDGDISGDGVVDGADLGSLLGAWGTGSPAADLDGSGTVDGADLGMLLGAWGPC